MIKLRKTIIDLTEFTKYVGHYCGYYEDYHILDKLDDLTSMSLRICAKKIEDLANCSDPYYVNLKKTYI